MITDAISNELFRNLFDVAPDPILIIDDKGKIVLVNNQTEKQFGYTIDSLVGRSLEILVPERFRAQHVQDRNMYQKNPHVRPMGSGQELFALKQDGTEFPVEISLSPMRTGSVYFIVAIVRDITARKIGERELRLANQELHRSNKELEEFAYIASHDLQEPLRSVAGSCQLLRRRYGDKLDSSAQEFIDFAVAGAKRMEELINDLLTYSRVSTKAREPMLTDLNKVLSDVLDNLRVAIGDSHAKITSSHLPTIAVDQWQICQLFQNLIANSLKFRGKEPPLVNILAVREGEFWHLSVSDNGIGIDSKYFERIFVVFKRLHSRDEYPGTGIGLASCKKIVERHGGQIWLESTLHRGTTFHFTLPCT